MTLPEELYDLVWEEFSAKIEKLQYERVTMSLPDLLEGDFFNDYIKSGMQLHSFRMLCEISTMCLRYMLSIFHVICYVLYGLIYACSLCFHVWHSAKLSLM